MKSEMKIPEEGLQKFDLKLYPIDTENPEPGMLGFDGKKVYVYFDGWVEIKDIEEKEEVYDKEGNKIGYVKDDRFYDFRKGIIGNYTGYDLRY